METHATAEASAPQSTKTKKTCRCGHARGDFWISAEPNYPMWRYLMGIFLGLGGGPPNSITFRCRKCGQAIEKSTHPDDIRRYRYS